MDNRCPHMGFPLSRGTVCEGLLTCHWHNARFDLASGGTLDPFADDVRAFPALVQDGQVLVDVSPEEGDRAAHWRKRLEEGLEDDLSLVAGQGDPGAAPGRHRSARDRPDRRALRRPVPRPRLEPGHDDPDRDGQRPAGPRARTSDRWRSTTAWSASPRTAPASRPGSTWSRCRPATSRWPG